MVGGLPPFLTRFVDINTNGCLCEDTAGDQRDRWRLGNTKIKLKTHIAYSEWTVEAACPAMSLAKGVEWIRNR